MVIKNVIQSILNHINGQKLLVIGDIIADEYIFGNTYRLSREAPIPIIRYKSSEVKPGGAGNVAMNIASLGGKVSLVGVIGIDSYGTELIKIFQSNSVSTDLILTANIQTVIKTRVLAGDINTAMQQIFRLDKGINNDYPPNIYMSIKENISKAINLFDTIVLSDYGEGLFTKDFIRWILKIASRKKVIVDSRFNFKSFKNITALTPNINEISQFYGRFVQTDRELEKATKRLKKHTNAKYILLKKGREGIAILGDNNKYLSYPAFGNIEVADVTGAGDTVLAAFALALSAGIQSEKAAQFANIAGGIKVQKRGTVPVSRDEIIRVINGKKI
ncbi:MAG: bifunctional ADP-heptose synthase [Deltaproteobacteria bacterium]|nr:bifunctional ADP-heptose synthase [Deltaproteobacteria bacterium]